MTEATPKHVREELHWLLDRIPESDVSTARKFLRSLVDPVVLSLLNAPYDDEPETEDERAAVEVARGESEPGTPHADVLREFGLLTFFWTDQAKSELRQIDRAQALQILEALTRYSKTTCVCA